MKDYLLESIDESGLEIVHTMATPAKRTLFEVDSCATPLDGDAVPISHRHIVIPSCTLHQKLRFHPGCHGHSIISSSSTTSDHGKHVPSLA